MSTLTIDKTKAIQEIAGDRVITIKFSKNGLVDIDCDAQFIAGERNRIMNTLKRWFRVSRRNYYVEQNQLKQLREEQANGSS